MPEPDTPFRILILGDFSGRASRDLAGRKPILVDRDNLDQVMAKLGVELELPNAGRLRFTQLEDFHPDRIFERVDLFRQLQEIPEIAELPPAPPKRGSLLEEIVGEPLEAPEQPAAAAPDEWKAYVRRLVAPYAVPGEDPRRAGLTVQAEAVMNEQMRLILRHPKFQPLEAGWRALSFLVHGLDTDPQLKVYILDASRAALAADLVSSDNLRSTALYRILVEQTVETPGSEPWALSAGNYTFDRSVEDVGLLARMAMFARRAGTPFLAAASPRVLGCESLAETPDPEDWQPEADPEGEQAWDMLRGMPESRYLGLALPRFLLRLPYGKESDRTENFEFEEMPEGSRHEGYLWGNPAFACAYLLGQAFSESGWGMQPGDIQQIDHLPLHVYEADGESQLKPCAETLLTETAAEAILDRGVMPLLSIAGRDAVYLARFQSIAKPPRPLAGNWR